MERVQLRETVKAYRSELEASETNSAAEVEALRKAHADEVRCLPVFFCAGLCTCIFGSPFSCQGHAVQQNGGGPMHGA
jgi:hypothetical protein